MATEYTYDDDGDTWPFFVLALLTFVLIPVSAAWIYNIYLANDPQSINSSIVGALPVDEESNQKWKNQFKKSKRSSKIFNKKLLFMIVGWFIIGYVARNFTREADLTGTFDPYSILDVSITASESEIKKKFRKMSLKYHPDKLPRDLSDQEREEREAEYVSINSAYKALTDEVTKQNFLRYGHPDGPQEVKHGIAIPQFLVEGKYSPVMILVYFLLIGGLLPAIVGLWWNNVKTHNKKGLHVETAANFARKLADRNPAIVITPAVILDWVLELYELKGFVDAKQQVHQYLDRNFNSVSPFIIAQLPLLISGLVDIALVFRQSDVILASADLQKSIASATPITGRIQALQQLPEVDFASIKQQKEVKTLGKLLSVDKATQAKVLGIDGAKLDRALEFARGIPTLRVVEVKFEVPGEEIVSPKSSAHIVVKFAVKAPFHKGFPEIEDDDERLKSPESMEYYRNPLLTNEDQPALPYASTPYFPDSFRLGWSVIVMGQQDTKIAEGVTVNTKLERASLSNMKLTAEQFLKDEGLVISTFRIPFTEPVPATEGSFFYRLILKNNAYFGCDVDVPVVMTVEPVKVAIFNNDKERRSLLGKREDELSSDEDSESDILDPEEDSIAGTLAALRGEQVKKSDKIEEIDSDDDNESVFTDINTDTEDEL